MRELDLLRQYLVRLRQERLQQGHQHALSATDWDGLMRVSNSAHEADIVQRIIGALAELDKDSGEFLHKYLK